ncbi:MAG: phosphoribosylformylglycinamidine synthase subunit PurS [Thermonemataceae bacterium]|nr:phosphoribosylformylglycinamidine synthase subunit PurS [Thermonemataceae bacterium]
MKFKAEINVMPLKEILDPQGKAVMLGLGHLGVSGVKDVRVGKHLSIDLEAENEEKAKEKVELACKKLLANPIMESFTYQISPINEKLGKK